MSRSDLQVNFRIPAELKARLEAAAKENRRSITAELVHRLEVTFSDDIESKPETDLPDIGAELDFEIRKAEEHEQASEPHMDGKTDAVHIVTDDQLREVMNSALESILERLKGQTTQEKGPRPRKKYPRP
ncbi:Arc family DNA-binding protein [Azotobacter chroococcum]|nr:Arc family DNA-binding protein [Azotobacter chroococcum]